MSYIIKDLAANEIIAACETKAEALCAEDSRGRSRNFLFLRRPTIENLKWHFDFLSLNITGKDIYPCARFLIMYDGNKYLKRQVSNEPTMLRPYQVLDENGRPQDVRLWTKEIEDVLKNGPVQWRKRISVGTQAEFRRDPIDGTNLVKAPRHKGYAMWHQTVAATERGDYMEDCDGYAPVLDHGQVRKRDTGLHSQWEQYERHLGYQSKTYKKSWKEKSKGHRQWSKNAPMSRNMKLAARNQKACPLYLGHDSDLDSEEELLWDLDDWMDTWVD